jgi:hypothetical protein
VKLVDEINGSCNDTMRAAIHGNIPSELVVMSLDAIARLGTDRVVVNVVAARTAGEGCPITYMDDTIGAQVHVSATEDKQRIAAQLAAEVTERWRHRSGPYRGVPAWCVAAIRALHDQVDQTNPACPVGAALTKAGLAVRP